VGREGVGLECGGRAATQAVGVGSRRPRATALAGLYGSAEEMGSGEDILLDRPEPQAELRDYERLPKSSEAFVYVAMSRLMARRLVRS
jgi:hypothetical protein